MNIAAITMVYNEIVNLPLWLRYYGNALGEENLYIVDHGTDDGSTENIAGNRLRIPRDKFSDGQRATFISKLHGALLSYYDAVIYTDCDEFLVPDPDSFRDLGQYVEAISTPSVKAVGLNLVHLIDEEDPIDFSHPIMEQRRFVCFRSPMCKTLISKTPIRWAGGFHGDTANARIDPALYMFHLTHFDVDNTLNRLKLTRDLNWASLRSAKHQRMDDEEALNVYRRYAVKPRKPSVDFSFAREIEQYELSVSEDDNGFFDSLPRFGAKELVEIPQRLRNWL